MEFLAKVAAQLYENEKNWGRYVMIFPNNRSITYFKKFYSAQAKKAVWSPNAVTISSFLSDYISGEQVSDLQATFFIFTAFKKVLGNDKMFDEFDLDTFFPYAQLIFSDFNEIDNYLVSPDDIFINLAQLEELSLDDHFLTDTQKDAIKRYWANYKPHFKRQFLIKLWNSLPQIYREFVKLLDEYGLTYSGLQKRRLVESVKAGKVTFDTYDKYVFVGFNALTKAEQEIMAAVKKTGKALFYWDYDEFYLKAPEHEAGMFLRRNIELLGNDLPKEESFVNTQKNVKIIGFPGQVVQAKSIEKLLKDFSVDLSNKEQLSKTAIILPDETLFLPVLYSLPEQIKEVNVTLSFPMHLTNIFPFFKAYCSLVGSLSLGKSIASSELESFLSLELSNSLAKDDVELLREKLRLNRKFYVALNFFNEEFKSEFFKHLFASDLFDSSEAFLSHAEAAVELILDHFLVKKDAFNREFVFHLLQSTRQLMDIVQVSDFELPVRIVLDFWCKNIRSIRVPFEGNTIEGLQIMTIMETRNLDFENVILLGMNEKIFPKPRPSQGFFTEFMRRAYDLPVLKYQDGIYAYLFYRLLHNAKNIALLYSADIPSGGNFGERSRFIEQLIEETPFIKQESILNYQDKLNTIKDEFYVEKSDFIDQRRQEITKISVSAFADFISCPRKFYFSRVVKLQIPQQEVFEIEYNNFGIIVHQTLENIYASMIESKGNNTILSSDIERILPDVRAFLSQAAQDNGVDIDKVSGVNKLYTAAALQYVRKVLIYDMHNVAPFSIVSLESEKFEDARQGKYSAIVDLGERKVEIYGYLDRVDKVGETLRVVDYKTGKDKGLDFSLQAEVVESTAPFQVMLYSYILYKSSGKLAVPHLYYISSLGKNADTVLKNKVGRKKKPVNSDTLVEILEEFEVYLLEKLHEIFELTGQDEKDLYPKVEQKKCTYCPYANICG